MHEQHAVENGDLGERTLELLAVQVPDSSMPDGDRKHLNPTTPASRRAARSPRFSGTAPPQ